MKSVFFIILALFEWLPKEWGSFTMFGKIIIILFFPVIFLFVVGLNIGFWLFMAVVGLSVLITMGLDYLGIDDKWLKNKLNKTKKIFKKS